MPPEGAGIDDRKVGLVTNGPGRSRQSKGFTSEFLNYPDRLWLWDKSDCSWIKEKRLADGAGDLWRVHDDLYDLTHFAAVHPGGRFWIEVTRGQDITELFEASHCLMTGVPERLLTRYRVGPAPDPCRNAPYTFLDDGFYRTLKRRAAPILRTVGTGPSRQAALMADTFVAAFVALSAAAGLWNCRWMALLAGLPLMFSVGTGHNFLHQRDNLRMYYLDLSFLSSAEWRVSHAMSHHVFPNTAYDLEITQVDPLLMLLVHSKSRLRQLISPLVHHLAAPFAMFIEAAKRLLRWCRGEQRPRPENFLPLLHLGLLTTLRYVTGGTSSSFSQSFSEALALWTITHSCASYLFLIAALSAAHHHPTSYHDGDLGIAERDWGVRQLDAVADKACVRGNIVLTTITFGDHGLHHLFPTVDHSKLVHLYGVFDRVCAEFGLRYRYFGQWAMFSGLYRQMARSRPRRSTLVQKEKDLK